MPDYKTMYVILCAAADKALDLLPDRPKEAMDVLQRALDQAEETYIETAGE